VIFGREPVAIAAFIAIAVNLFVSFGLRLTVEQISLINGLVVAGLALIARQQVTPTAAPVLPDGKTVTISGTGQSGTVTPTSPTPPSS
jgi:hypothetical protein